MFGAVVALRAHMTRQIHALTGLRGVAALWVVGFHIGPELVHAVPWLAPIGPLLASGYLGVDLFFALSGYVLALRYGPEWSAGATDVHTYLRRRIARIFPLHAAVLVTLTAGVVVARALDFERFAASGLWRADRWLPQLLLVHAWGGQEPAWNVPSWSLSCEWLGYLALPTVLPVAWRCSARLARVVAAAILLTGLAIGVAVHGHWNLTHEGAVVRFAASFFAGMVAARAHGAEGEITIRAKRGRQPWHRSASPALAGAAVVAAAAGASPFLIVPLLVALVVGLAGDRGVLGRALAAPPMRALGRLSFALYLVHEVVMLVVGTTLSAEIIGAVPSLVVQVACVAGATFVAHHAFEEPARRWLLSPRASRSRA